MAFVIADRVKETSTSTGTGNFTLSGAASGFQAFSAALSSSDTTYYVIVEQGGTNWEVGIGTFTSPSTLARTTVLSSSNSGNAVNFAAGTKDVFITLPAGRTVQSVDGGTTGLTPSTASYGAITLAGTLVAANGGTGQSSYTIGDLLYASGSTALSKLAGVATGNALISGGVGTAPSYGKIGLTTHISGTLPIANGGTNGTTAATGFDNLAPTTTQGDIIYRGASSNTRLAAGTTSQVLIGGTTPSWGAANLTSMVTGTLPVGNGGTGATTLTANNVILGNGTSAVQFVAPGTNGNVLTSNGTVWASAAPAGGGSLIFLSTVTASNSSTVDVETTFNSTYDAYKIVASGCTNDTGTARLYVRLKVNGSYQTTGYYAAYLDAGSAAAGAFARDSNQSQGNICRSIQGSSGGSFSFETLVCYPSSTSLKKYIFTSGYANDDNQNGVKMIVSAVNYVGTGDTAALTGVRFFMSSGNISSGTFRLYGIKNS